MSRRAVLVLLVATAAGCGQLTPEEERVVISLGAQDVTRVELDRFLGSRTGLGGTLDAPLLSALLEEFVREQLLVIAARESGVEVSEMQLLAELAALRAGPGTDAVRAESDSGPREAADGDAEGPGDDDWLRAQVEARLLVDRFVETSVLADMEATDEAVQLEYEANRAFYARPETVSLSERRFDSREEAEAAAEQLRAAGAAGESGDAADEFVRIGSFRPGELPDAVDLAVFRLEPGATTGAVETAAGFRIFRVDQRLPAGSLAFGDVEDVVRLTVLRREADNRVQALVEELQARHPVTVHVDNLGFPYLGVLPRAE